MFNVVDILTVNGEHQNTQLCFLALLVPKIFISFRVRPDTN